MQIAQVMTRHVQLVNPATKLKDAATMMRENDIGFLPVGDNDRLIGTLTDRDIVCRSVAMGPDPNVATVRDAMSEDILYCYEDEDTNEAANLMAEHQVRRMPVLNREKRLVGILSLGDLAVETPDSDIIGQTVEDVSKDTGKPRNL